jgi:maltose alpha-D-glucosyltransferase / alpha-amylase
MNDLWYKQAIVYAVDVRTFCDSNADGWGDFPGLTQKLDYLHDLGITCLWLLPFYPSPNRDNGYDISDYLTIDPRFGTLEDFETFLHAAGERGIRVVLDLIVNHTSDQHPWFQAARRDPGARFRDYYVWTEQPAPTDQPTIFPGEESSVWTYDQRASAYFFHLFYHFQPDLRIANPDVRDEIRRILDFWLSLPVAGFRVDAASHMIEDKGLPGTAPENSHGVLKELHGFVAERRPGTVLIGEADVPLSHIADFFGDGDELNLIFNFLLDNDLMLALASESAEPVARCLRELPAVSEKGQWLNFLRNLDELDLERLSDDEREQVYQAFAPEENMRIFGRGIRRRLAPMLGGDQGDQRRLRMAFSLLLSMPGTPVIVYGDEIGMGDDLALEGRSSVRTAMQWSAEKNAGFSDAEAGQLIRPAVTEGPFGYKRLNVDQQLADPDSLLSWMKGLVTARRDCYEFGMGNCQVLSTDEPRVLLHLCDWQGSRLLAIHNLCGERCRVKTDLSGSLTAGPALLFGDVPHEWSADGTCEFELTPYAYGWFRSTAER